MMLFYSIYFWTGTRLHNGRIIMMLAHTKTRTDTSDWMVSEKLDGMRFYWDGGISRGIPKKDVPFANHEKDDRFITPPVATGLWSRNMNVIHAPDVWLDRLPKVPLDGELWKGYDFRQSLMHVVKQRSPSVIDWETVTGHVFDVPPFDVLFPEHMEWIRSRPDVMRPARMRYSIVYKFLLGIVKSSVLKVVKQHLHVDRDAMMAEVLKRGGEGLMLRNPNSFYEDKRSYNLIKVKPFDDAEGVITGWIAGKGKYLGMMGALILDVDGIRLELSGFTDAERRVKDEDWAMRHPGEEAPERMTMIRFRRGSKVTFKYRGLTKDNVPMEARYWRKHVQA